MAILLPRLVNPATFSRFQRGFDLLRFPYKKRRFFDRKVRFLDFMSFFLRFVKNTCFFTVCPDRKSEKNVDS